MKLKVSTKEAVNKGQLVTILLPFILAFVFTFFIPLAFIEFTKNKLLMCAAGGVIIAFAFRNFIVIYWKLWAYENADNIHALRDKAITYRVISPENSFFGKFEIKTKSQKSKLKELEKRFLKDNPIYDDYEIPKVTHIRRSRVKMYINIVIGCIMIGSGIFVYFNVQEKNKTLTYIFALSGIFILFDNIIRLLRNTAPSLTINDKGIYSSKTKTFFSWDEIYSTEFDTISHNDYIKIHHKHGTEQVKIDRMTMSLSDFQHILNIYSLRYEKNKNMDDRMKMRELN